MTQHASLTLDRWRRFPPEQQLLMVANEFHRLFHYLALAQPDGLRGGYERVLRLTDLTVQAAERRGLRRELLRWRDLVAALYVAPESDRTELERVERALLLLFPAGAAQLRALYGTAVPRSS